MSQNLNNKPPEPYRTDLINAAMGAKRLTNDDVAAKATEIRRRDDPGAQPVAPRSVSAVRNGDPKVKLPTLRAVAEAVGVSMTDLFQPKENMSESAV